MNRLSSLFSSFLLISFLSWLVYSYVVAVRTELSRVLQGSSSLRKHVYGSFIKVIIKEGVRAKEVLECISSKFSFLKPNKLVSMPRIFTCVLFANLESKVKYILNIRYYITEKDLSSCRHMNRRGS